jgi:hypothetical protein
MLRWCFFNGQRRRMRGAIRFDRPTGQEQAQNDTQNHLFLFGQAVHARQCSGKLASPQWEIGSGKQRLAMAGRSRDDDIREKV